MVKKKLTLRDFDLDFDEIKIIMPGKESMIKVKISDQLLVNRNLPGDVLDKMSECAARYARWGVIRGEMAGYKELLEDEFDEFMFPIKATALALIGGKPSETRIEEKAILDNVKEYSIRRKELRRVSKALEQIKRVMRAFEMQSELLRSIKATLKTEEEMIEKEDSVVKKNPKKKGSMKNY